MTEKSKVGVNLNGNSRVFGALIGGETIESTWKIHDGRSFEVATSYIRRRRKKEMENEQFTCSRCANC